MTSRYVEYEKDLKHYGIRKGSSLSVINIMSIIFYTDYSSLSTLFSSTFRPLSKNESNKSIKKRNSYFWHWTKILNQTIHLFGNEWYAPNDILKSNEEPAIPILYHGVNFMYFDQFNAHFQSPTSMTRQLEV